MPLSFDCPHRILIGPLYSSSLLGRWHGHPNILSFNARRAVTLSEHNPFRPLQADIVYAEKAGFAEILDGLPTGWEPDLVIWSNLSLMGLPAGIEDCPYPTLAIVHDWHLNLPAVLDYVHAFDYVVCDKGLKQILERLGFARCAYWSCYAHDPLQHYLLPGSERSWDVVFPGNISYNFHGGRNAWIQRLLALDPAHKVLISDRRYGQGYLQLLNQSKIVFNYAIRGEMNMRAYEAAACGALLFQEENNLEIRDYLVDGESCVLYNEENLAEKIEFYLADDEERQRIARKGAEAISNFDCEKQFQRLIDFVPAVRAAFESGARQAFRRTPPLWREMLRRQQQAHSRTAKGTALAPIQSAGTEQAHLQALNGALALRLHWDAARLLNPGPLPTEAVTAVQSIETGVRALPGHLWHAYNLACGLTLLRQPDQALPLWSQLLPRLQSLQPAELDPASLSWRPEKTLQTLFPFSYLWDSTAGTALNAALGDLLAGKGDFAALRQLLLQQAFELIGYCLIYARQPVAAIQAFEQALNHGSSSYFSYAPLLQLLAQSGRQTDYQACLARAAGDMALAEFLQRERIGLLARQGSPELLPALDFYRRLLTRIEGGGPKAAESAQAWVPDMMLWIPELLEQQTN